MTDLREKIADVVNSATLKYYSVDQATDAIMSLIGWRDMGDAPRDGTWFLIYDADGGGEAHHACMVARWHIDNWYGEGATSHHSQYGIAATPSKPTHFMPLPPPPSK